MSIFNSILENINNIIIIAVSIAFSFQLIYTLLFFLPSKKFPKAKTKHKVGIIIPAKNEADII